MKLDRRLLLRGAVAGGGVTSPSIFRPSFILTISGVSEHAFSADIPGPFTGSPASPALLLIIIIIILLLLLLSLL